MSKLFKRSMAALIAAAMLLTCCGSVPAFALTPEQAASASEPLDPDTEALPETAEETATPETADAAEPGEETTRTPEDAGEEDPVMDEMPETTAEEVEEPSAAPQPPIPDALDILYAEMPDRPTGSYMGSYGLPVATGDTKISISEWKTDLLDENSRGHLDAEALNVAEPTVSIGKVAGQDYAIVPILVQVEYPANGSATTVTLPDTVELLSYTSTENNLVAATEDERANILNAVYYESSAGASGFYVKAAGDFSATFTYTAPDGTGISKTLTVQVTDDVQQGNALRADEAVPGGIMPLAVEGPPPAITSGYITKIEYVVSTWLIWFAGQEAYCCSHGLNGQPTGCPPYSYQYTSLLEAGQYTEGNHYLNQVNIWGGLNQLSLSEPVQAGFRVPANEISTFSDVSQERKAPEYDDVQKYIIENFPDSVVALIYTTSAAAAEQKLNGIQTLAAGDNGYYTYIYMCGRSDWQTVALVGPPVGDTPVDPGPTPEPQEFYASWSAPAQSASGSLDLTYTLTIDKVGLATREKVDGAVIDVEPLVTSNTIDGGSWNITPAGKQTLTTVGHKQDSTYHQTGGAASASWKLHYEVRKTSTSALGGQVGPYSSQAEADEAAANARAAAESQLQNEAQSAVDAALAAARQQLATLNFKVNERLVPFGFEPYTGSNGSSQQVEVPSDGSKTVTVQNDEWSVKLCIDKRDSKTSQRIAGTAEFAFFEWDTVEQLYIPYGGYNQYKVERQRDGTYKVINHSDYAGGSDDIYYTQRNEGKFLIVESKAPSGYYGDWTEITNPGTAGGVTGKRAYCIELTKALDGTTLWLGNDNYNADIATGDNGGTRLRTPDGKVVSVAISPTAHAAGHTYPTDPGGLAANEDSFTTHPQTGKFQNTRVLGQIVLNKTDLDALRYLSGGEHGSAVLDGALYDLYAAEDIRHPDGKTGVVDYSKITDSSGTPLWHTSIHTNSGWDTAYLPILSKDNLVASAAIRDGQLTFTNLYLGRYYLVERSTGAVLPVDRAGQYYNSGSYPAVNDKLERTGRSQKLASLAGRYTDYLYHNQFSTVAESRNLDGTRAWDGYYLSFAKGYLCDETNHYAALAYADEAQYLIRSEDTSQDAVLKSGFELTKLISTSGPPSPAPMLEGAGFTVFMVSSLSKAEQFKKLPDGRYDLQSILDLYRAESYDQDTPKYDFTGEAQAVARMYESDSSKMAAYNASLTESGDNANGSGLGWQPGRLPNEYSLSEIFTNSSGKFRVDGLPYGQYLVVETTLPQDLFQAAPFLVTVDENAPQSVFCTSNGAVLAPTGNYMTYHLLDEEFEVCLQLIKVDTETGKPVRLADTAFAIYYLDDTGHYRPDAEGNPRLVEMPDPRSGNAAAKTTVFYTDAEGYLKTPEKLPLGRYRVVELTGPKGYYNEWADSAFYRDGALAGDGTFYLDFEVTTDGVYQVHGSATNDMDDTILTAEYHNSETLGQLTIRKTGDVLTGYEDGQFLYEPVGLAGAVFEIRAKEDVATPDNQGRYWYLAGDLVATVTTGAAGQIDEVTFAPTRTAAAYDFLTASHDGSLGEVTVTLPLGCYTVKEVKAPYGFALSDLEYTVTFAWDGQTNKIVLAQIISDGESITYFKGVDTANASRDEINERKLVFHNSRVVPAPQENFGRIGVGLYKRDRESLEFLPGAVYALYTVDAIYGMYGNKLADAGALLATSDPTNDYGFTWFAVDIPIRGEEYAGGRTEPEDGVWDARYNSGRYRIVEQAAPVGSLLDTTPLEVEFTYNGGQPVWQVVDTTHTNLKTTVHISKVELFGGNELPGAVLTVLDDAGAVIHKWTSSNAPYIIRGLELGKAYTLVEEQSPQGYTVAESVTFKLEQAADENGELLQSNDVFVLDMDGAWQLVESQTVVMKDAPALVIRKTDVGGKELPGAQLSLLGSEGETVDTWVNGDEPHEVPVSTAKNPMESSVILSDEEKERVFVLHEDTAPAGFLVASDIQFKVALGEAGHLRVFTRAAENAPWQEVDGTALTMVDEAQPAPTPSPAPSPKPEPTPAPMPGTTPNPTSAPTPVPARSVPQTGDNTPLALLAALLICSAAGLAGAGWAFRKRR